MIVTQNDPFMRYADYAVTQIADLQPSAKFNTIMRISNWVFETRKTPIIINYCIDCEDKMARFSDHKFADVKLDKKDLPAVENLAESMEDDLEALFDIFADDGIKVSISYSEKQSAVIVSLTPTKDSRLRDGITMTTWGKTFTETMWMAGYKHIVMCERKNYPEKKDGEIWG